jgi:hypothetical protein
MEDMKVLPDHEVLYLNVLANGQSFGASSFHVLRMCVGIRMLVLTLLDDIHLEVKVSFVYIVLSLLKKKVVFWTWIQHP